MLAGLFLSASNENNPGSVEIRGHLSFIAGRKVTDLRCLHGKSIIHR